jgi:hypothetical protein
MLLEIGGLPGIPGTVIDNARLTSVPGTSTPSADKLRLAPMVWPGGSVKQIDLEIATGIAGSKGRILVYGSGPQTLFPEDLIIDSEELDCASPGFKSRVFSEAIPIVEGHLIWVGTKFTSSSIAVRGLPVNSVSNLPLGINKANSNYYNNVIVLDQPFATVSPSLVGLCTPANFDSKTATRVRFSI